MPQPVSSPRQEATRAIQHAITMLREHGPALSPLISRLTVGALEHALEQLDLIREVKRARPVRKAEEPSPLDAFEREAARRPVEPSP